jgi:DNA-directed RNA polymerase subunit omega
MTWQHDTMMNPPIEELFARSHSKFRLVTLGATRAREINAYFGQLQDGIGKLVPPQVASVARKPLSIAFEEIAADKIVGIPVDPEVKAAEAQAEADAAAALAAE